MFLFFSFSLPSCLNKQPHTRKDLELRTDRSLVPVAWLLRSGLAVEPLSNSKAPALCQHCILGQRLWRCSLNQSCRFPGLDLPSQNPCLTSSPGDSASYSLRTTAINHTKTSVLEGQQQLNQPSLSQAPHAITICRDCPWHYSPSWRSDNGSQKSHSLVSGIIPSVCLMRINNYTKQQSIGICC